MILGCSELFNLHLRIRISIFIFLKPLTINLMSAIIFIVCFVISVRFFRVIGAFGIVLLLLFSIVGLIVLESGAESELAWKVAIPGAILMSVLVYPMLPHTRLGHKILGLGKRKSAKEKILEKSMEDRVSSIEKFLTNANKGEKFTATDASKGKKVFCGSCYKIISIYDDKCPFCSKPVSNNPLEIATCPICGADRKSPKSQFCSSCGEKFELAK